MLLLKTNSLSGGLDYDASLLALAALNPAVWLEGGLIAGAWVDKLTGRRFVPLAETPATISSGSKKAVAFAGCHGLKAEDSADVISSLNAYSIVTLARIHSTAGGGGMIANDLTANQMLHNIHSSGKVRFYSSFSTSAGMALDATVLNSNQWYAHSVVVDCTNPGARSSVLRRDGAQVDSTTSDLSLSSSTGGRQLLIGISHQSSGYSFVPFQGDIGLVLLFNRALSADDLAAVETYAANLKTAST